MRRPFISLLIFLSFCSAAKTSLVAFNVSPYQKSLYNEAIKHNINGAMPLNSQSFSVVVEGGKMGDFIAGKGFNAHDNNVCFVGWSEKKPTVKTVIPTIGFDDREAEVCNETKSVGIVSSDKDPATKIAVIYLAASPNATADEAIIFSVDSTTHDIDIDKALTAKVGSSGAKTIKELKKKLSEQP
ncbi:hypothetical protein [Erwinia mallotivora]|uniref:hypothetical protein n=2 Tax=Erwinia mallotivora TaxID=69222 RepID=UPI0021C239E4|nr:hypothetical protein [Erwinia mallotivora]